MRETSALRLKTPVYSCENFQKHSLTKAKKRKCWTSFVLNDILFPLELSSTVVKSIELEESYKI